MGTCEVRLTSNAFFLPVVAESLSHDDYFRFKYFFSSFLRGGACLFTGLALSNKFETEIKKKEINSSLAPEEMIQKMEQLTHLLEKSIITKEEFEEKKKQVLGVNAPNPSEQEVKEESSN